jgi:outer membrane immunogenic protein
MKQFKLAASLFVSISLLSSAAFAQISFKDEAIPFAVTAPHDWTGFYAGLNAGAVRHTLSITDNQATTFNATIQEVSNPQFTGGFQLGYRRQLDLTKASGIYGLEFSANFSNATFNKEYGSAFALYQLSAENTLLNVCLLQLVGGIAADKALLFLTAGLSWTNLSGSMSSQTSVPFFNSFNVDKKALGTTVGAGFEYAFNEKISARLKVDAVTPNTYTTYNNVGDAFQISNSIVQGTFGVNYQFA